MQNIYIEEKLGKLETEIEYFRKALNYPYPQNLSASKQILTFMNVYIDNIDKELDKEGDRINGLPIKSSWKMQKEKMEKENENNEKVFQDLINKIPTKRILEILLNNALGEVDISKEDGPLYSCMVQKLSNNLYKTLTDYNKDQEYINGTLEG